MNFARENTLPLPLSFSFVLSFAPRSKEWWVSNMSAFDITVVLSYLSGSCLEVSCYTEDFVIFHKQISENMTSYHRILH